MGGWPVKHRPRALVAMAGEPEISLDYALLRRAFNARTLVPGLYLSGQDVMSPGIAEALAGEMLCAAAIDPRVFQKLR